MEIWKSIAGFEGFYEISDRGRVRSLDRIVGGPLGPNTRIFPGKLLQPVIMKIGYQKVSLRNGARTQQRYVHELVLETFIGPRPQGAVARHFPDACKTNNAVNNLCWGAEWENAGDYRKHYISDKDIERVHSLRESGWSQQDIADEFEISQGYVSGILCNKRRATGTPSENRSVRNNRPYARARM